MSVRSPQRCGGLNRSPKIFRKPSPFRGRLPEPSLPFQFLLINAQQPCSMGSGPYFFPPPFRFCLGFLRFVLKCGISRTPSVRVGHRGVSEVLHVPVGTCRTGTGRWAPIRCPAAPCRGAPLSTLLCVISVSAGALKNVGAQSSVFRHVALSVARRLRADGFQHAGRHADHAEQRRQLTP